MKIKLIFLIVIIIILSKKNGLENFFQFEIL